MKQTLNGVTTEFLFSSTLLLPLENLNSPYRFIWVNRIQTEDNTIDVIVFKTSQKEEIKSLLEKDLKDLNKLEPLEDITRQISFIEKTLGEMKNPLLLRRPEQFIMDVVNREISRCMKISASYIAENVIYISGVAAAYRVG